MSDQDRLEYFLNRWEDASAGERLLLEREIGDDCPDLLPEFHRRTAKLREIGSFLDGETPTDRDQLTAAGRYRPLELYAHGGLGEVFRAHDDELGREVALKRIRVREVVDSQRASRFKFEAEITGRLDHPGVVPVYGLGRDASGRLYYAMRFINGTTLQQAIDAFHHTYPPGKLRGKGAAELQKLVRSFLAVCQTIAYAHSQDVIHRDLKPANIMLGSYGETLVVDWGLAKRILKPVAADAETLELTAPAGTVMDRTMLGQIKGSPAYMSPEQAEGSTDLIGAPSDIYSLGATLYTLLAGKLPFAEPSVYALLDKVKRSEFVPPRQVREDIPPALEAICLKAMSHKPCDRYATALEMAADLENWLADDAVAAWREPWTSKAARWMRKHQTLTSATAAALVVALLGISALAAQRQQANDVLGQKNTQLVAANTKERDARTAAEVAEKKAKDAADDARRAEANAKKREAEARAAEDEARHELYAFLILSADRALDNGDRTFAEQTLDQCPEKFRNVEWRLLYRRAMGCRASRRLTQGNATSVALSRDGKLLAAAGSEGPVRIWNRAENRLVAELAGPARQVAFLADGDHLLVRAIHRFDLPLRDGDTTRIDSPGDLELWSISQRKKLDVWSLAADQMVLSADDKRLVTISVSWPTFDAKNPEVASRIMVYDLPGGRLLAVKQDVSGQVIDAAFSPDHRRLYCVTRQVSQESLSDKISSIIRQGMSDHFLIQAWDVAEAKQTLQLVYSKSGTEKSENADAAGLAISPDGKLLYVSDQARQLVPDGPNMSRMTQGRILAFDAATGEAAKAATFDLDARDVMPVEQKARPFNVLTTLEMHAGGLAVSPDGKRLAVITGRRIYVFDRTSGKRLAELAGHTSPPQCVVFDKVGTGLATAGGDDGRVNEWDLDHPLADRMVLPGGQAADGRGIAISHDSRRFAVAEEDGGIGIYDVASGQRRMALPPISTAVSQDKLSAAAAIYPLKNDLKEAYGTGYRAMDVRFSPDGKRLVAVYYDRFICVWDLTAEKPKVVDFIDELALEPNQGYRLYTHLLLSSDGRYLASESYRGQETYFRVWEIEKRRLVASHEKDDFLGLKPRMLFSADSKFFYLERGSPKSQPPVLEWDLATGKPVDTAGLAHLLSSTDQVSPDGARQLRIVEGVIKIEDRTTGRTLIEYAGQERYYWAIFSPDGNYILACKDKTAELFDATPVKSAEGKP